VAEDEAARERMLAANNGVYGMPTILVDGRVVMAGGVFHPSIFAGVTSVTS
jgi:predicted thioredoxin/glutaredoxin